jgi:predicted RNA-binding Zn ribbon-like protein
MTEQKRYSGNLKLLGGKLCLDFINTLDWRGTEKPVEFLNTYHDLVVWSRHAGVCTIQDSRQLSAMAKQSETMAKKIHLRALSIREIMYRIFSAISQNKNPSKEDLTGFNQQLSASMQGSQIVRIKIFNPIVRSAAELLVSADLQNIKSCADPACGWLFLDTSRNKRRRWCDMRDCGNRAKASRFYNKKQGRRL